MSGYKIAFIAYTIMSVLNLAVVLAEIRETHSLITIARMLSEVCLHLVVAWTYYNEWQKSKEEDKEKQPFTSIKKIKKN